MWQVCSGGRALRTVQDGGRCADDQGMSSGFLSNLDVGEPPTPRPPRRVGRRTAVALSPFVTMFGVVSVLFALPGRPSSFAIHAAFFAVPVVMLLVALWPTRRDVWSSMRRLRRAVRASATIVAIEESGVATDLANYRRTAVVRYAGPDALMHERPARGTAAPTAESGDAVEVRIDPRDPAWCMLDAPLPGPLLAIWQEPGAYDRLGVLLASLFAAVMAVDPLPAEVTLPVIVLLILWLGRVSVRRSQRTLVEYRARYARSVEVHATVVDVAQDARGRVGQPTFSYCTADGVQRTSRSRVPASRRSAAHVEYGQPVRVRYDPTNPQWVVPIAATPELVQRYARLNLATFFGVALLVPAFLIFGLPALR